MSRLGLSAAEFAALASEGSIARLNLVCSMSHLACADTPEHPQNARQLGAYRGLAAQLPDVSRSLAASSGIFLGADYHFDLLRPGAALWGLNPTPEAPNPMRQVVTVKGKILQLLEIDEGRSVGYGATHIASGATSVATVGAGYADGYLRAAGNRAHAYLGAVALPVLGRISMDLIGLDVTALPREACVPGSWVDLLGPAYGADDLARDSGTSGYEVLTRLSQRLPRIYIDGAHSR
jgi:alanine racemase